MQNRLPACLVLCSALATGTAFAAPDGEGPGIVGGTSENYDPGVVALLASNGTLVCSGVILSEEVVLTAAHCLDNAIAIVRIADDITGPKNDWHVREAMPHANYTGGARGSDLGLLLVGRALPKVDHQLPDSNAWQSFAAIDVVGFGQRDEQGASGQQSRRSTEVTSVSDIRFRHGESSCYGDSGGAVFDSSSGTRRLVGIVSSGAADCKGESNAVRVDAHLVWIEKHLRSAQTNVCLDIDSGCHAVVGSCSTSGSLGTQGFAAFALAFLLSALRRRRRQRPRQ